MSDIFEQLRSEFCVNATTGETRCTIKGAALLCGVSEGVICDLLPDKTSYEHCSNFGIPDLGVSDLIANCAFLCPRLINIQAQETLMAIIGTGLRTKIHEVLNYI